MKPVIYGDVEQKILELANKIPTKEIAKITGVKYNTIKYYLYRKNLIIPQRNLNIYPDEVANMRLTKTVKQVAEHYKKTTCWVRKKVKDHPLKKDFCREIMAKPKPIKQEIKVPKTPKTKQVEKPVEKPKPLTKQVKKAITKSKTSHKPSKEESLEKMNKGEVKLKKDEKILSNRVFDRKQQREVKLKDIRNTSVFVNINDPRTDEEIRQHFADRGLKELESLKKVALSKIKKINTL